MFIFVVKNDQNIILLDRFRPACLPMRQSLLSERHGSMVYGLIRGSSFNISQATTFKSVNYTLVENKMCLAYRSEPTSNDSGFCVETGGVSDHEGDPIMVILFSSFIHVYAIFEI